MAGAALEVEEENGDAGTVSSVSGRREMRRSLRDVLVLRTRRVSVGRRRSGAGGVIHTDANANANANANKAESVSALVDESAANAALLPSKVRPPLSLSLSLSPLPLPSPSPLLPVSALLPLFHPLYPYASQPREYKVSLATSWFGGDMPYYRGAAVCPASGCRVELVNRGGAGPDVDVVLYHAKTADFNHNPPPPARPNQLVAMMAAEGFDLAEKSSDYFGNFNAEHSFRATSITRDTYVLWFLNDAHKQGIAHPQRPLRLDARVWGDIWEAPIAYAQRDTKPLASWGSSYCSGARSNRETLVRELLAAGIDIAIYGEEGNCLRNVKTPRSGDQYREMRAHKFYLAFENHRIDGYVTEKVSGVWCGCVASAKREAWSEASPASEASRCGAKRAGAEPSVALFVFSDQGRTPAPSRFALGSFLLAILIARLRGAPPPHQFYWALLRGQVPVVYGAPDIARFAPSPSSYIDASTFPTAALLAEYLKKVGSDESLYATYHAWRTRLSFADYGDVLRDELIEAIWIGNATMVPAEWYECRWCHALERARARGDLDRDPQQAMGIKTIAATAKEPWQKKVG